MNDSTDTRQTGQAPASRPAPETTKPPALAELVKALQGQAALDAEIQRHAEQDALVARNRFD